MSTPNVLDIYVDPMAHTAVVGQSLRISTGHADLWLRFPVAMPADARAAFLAQLAAVATSEEARYLAADAAHAAVVPVQRVGGRSE
jgi:hypothetical protein